MITLYNVVSQDGYIADAKGSENFIPDELWPITLSLISKYDTFVTGRKTYDALQKYPEKLLKLFEELSIKKIIVTRDTHFQPKVGYTVVHSPQEASALGKNILVSSGPNLNMSLISLGLVDQVIYHQIPVMIHGGIKPFDLSTEKSLLPISEVKLMDGIREVVCKVIHWTSFRP